MSALPNVCSLSSLPKVAGGIAAACVLAVGAAATSDFAPVVAAYAGQIAAASQRSTVALFPYLSGGNAGERLQAMRLLAKNYNLRLAIAVAGKGIREGDVRVTIQDARGGTVIDAHADGPLFYAKLPRGLYRVVVENDGRSLAQIVNLISWRKAEVQFYLPASQRVASRTIWG